MPKQEIMKQVQDDRRGLVSCRTRFGISIWILGFGFWNLEFVVGDGDSFRSRSVV